MHIFFYSLQKFAVQDKMKSSGSEDDFVILSLLEKRKREYSSNPKTRQEQREFHLLIKKQDAAELS